MEPLQQQDYNGAIATIIARRLSSYSCPDCEESTGVPYPGICMQCGKTELSIKAFCWINWARLKLGLPIPKLNTLSEIRELIKGGTNGSQNKAVSTRRIGETHSTTDSRQTRMLTIECKSFAEPG